MGVFAVMSSKDEGREGDGEGERAERYQQLLKAAI